MHHPALIRTVAGLALVALLAGAAYWATRPEPVEVTLVTVGYGRVEERVANTRVGTVKACRRAGLSPSIGGQIVHLPAREGARVTRGQVLLELWHDDLTAKLIRARHDADRQYAKARASCAQADEAVREADRLQALRAQDLVATEVYEQGRTEAQVQEAECAAAGHAAQVAQAELGVLEAELARTRLLAPFDGVVAEVRGELFEYVTPSPVGIPTAPVIDLIDPGCFTVSAPIDELDAARLQPGLPARITLDAYPDRHFSGEVQRVADYVEDIAQQARTLEVEVGFAADTDLSLLLPGYSADVEIILETRDRALRIPTEALLPDQQVYVYDPATRRLTRQRIRTGLANWDVTEVLGGLEPGTRIVRDLTQEGLDDGQPVRALTEEAPP